MGYVAVPPGKGKPTTQKRNERKRKLKSFRDAEARAAAGLDELPQPAPKARPKSEPKAVAPTEPAARLAQDMQALAKGNRNKRKTIVLTKAGVPLTRPEGGAEAVVAVEGTPVEVEVETAPSSPSYEPSSPAPMEVAEPMPVATPVTNGKGKKKGGFEKHLHSDAPSLKTNLPPNVIVTKVDVEAEDWVAGVGRVIAGTSRYWVPIVAPVLEPLEVEVDAQMEDAEEEAEEDWGREWKGWLSVGAVEKGWDRFKELGEASYVEGRRVAFKVSILFPSPTNMATNVQPPAPQLLELDPFTFAPTLSLKYGRQLPPTATAPLRIKLHPACLPEEEEYVEEEILDDDAVYYGTAYRPKPKFGEPLDEEDAGGNGEANWTRAGMWEGEWQEGVRLVK